MDETPRAEPSEGLGMNIIDKAEQIIYSWLSFADKNNKIEGIASQSRSVMWALQENGGEMGGGYGSDALAHKADLMKSIPITQTEKLAREALMGLPVEARFILVMWVDLKNKEKEETKERFKETDAFECLVNLGLPLRSFEAYQEIRKRYCKILVSRAERLGLKTEAAA